MAEIWSEMEAAYRVAMRLLGLRMLMEEVRHPEQGRSFAYRREYLVRPDLVTVMS